MANEQDRRRREAGVHKALELLARVEAFERSLANDRKTSFERFKSLELTSRAQLKATINRLESLEVSFTQHQNSTSDRFDSMIKLISSLDRRVAVLEGSRK